MKKAYVKPEAELLSLIAEEEITTKADLQSIVDGSTGIEDAEDGW